jgi:hypothetical protein
MNRRLLPVFVFTLCLCAAASAQTRPTPPPESPTPAWLPRAAFLGTYLRNGAVVPEARVQWQLPFFRGRLDSLSLVIEPTAALAAAFPASLVENEDVRLTSLRLYSLMLGVGYVSRRESGLEWGFQFGTGPAWYSARFTGGSKDRESYFIGLLGGRAQVGYRFGPISLGVAVGYSDPYNHKRTSLARGHVGGLQLGLYADWR